MGKEEEKRGRKKIIYEDIVTPEVLEIIKMSVASGAIDKDIIKFLGISRSVFYRFKAEYKEFSDALKMSKEIADKVVESALFKSATGYKNINKRIIYDEFGNAAQVIEDVETVKPNVTAIIFWLKNRKPQDWRDRRVDTAVSEDEAVGIIEITEVKPRDESEYQEESAGAGADTDAIDENETSG